MGTLLSIGSETSRFSAEQLQQALNQTLDTLGSRQKVLAIPPDFTRFHSGTGRLTRFLWDYYGDRLTDVLPALGTHTPMTDEQIARMFPGVPRARFRDHDWRRDVVTLGTVPAEFIREQSEGKLNYEYPAQVNKLL